MPLEGHVATPPLIAVVGVAGLEKSVFHVVLPRAFSANDEGVLACEEVSKKTGTLGGEFILDNVFGHEEMFQLLSRLNQECRAVK